MSNSISNYLFNNLKQMTFVLNYFYRKIHNHWSSENKAQLHNKLKIYVRPDRKSECDKIFDLFWIVSFGMNRSMNFI